jgi:hypothetical protein
MQWCRRLNVGDVVFSKSPTSPVFHFVETLETSGFQCLQAVAIDLIDFGDLETLETLFYKCVNFFIPNQTVNPAPPIGIFQTGGYVHANPPDQ